MYEIHISYGRGATRESEVHPVGSNEVTALMCLAEYVVLFQEHGYCTQDSAETARIWWVWNAVETLRLELVERSAPMSTSRIEFPDITGDDTKPVQIVEAQP